MDPSHADPEFKKYTREEVNRHSEIELVFLPSQHSQQLLAMPRGYHLWKTHQKKKKAFCGKRSPMSCPSCLFHWFSLEKKKKQDHVSWVHWTGTPASVYLSLGSTGLFQCRNFQTALRLHAFIGKWNTKVVSVLLAFTIVLLPPSKKTKPLDSLGIN